MSAKTLKAFAIVGDGYGETPDQLEVAATDGVQLAVFATIPAAAERVELDGEQVLAEVILSAVEHDGLINELERTKRFMEINANSAQGKHLEGLRYREQRDALQLRLNAADQRIDELTAKPSDAECERLMEIIERYPNGDPLQYNAAVKEVSKIIGIERMPPMEYDEP